jgi:hypothetical protein
MTELIEQAKHAGEIRADVDASLLAYNLFALYFSFQLLWLRGDEPSPHRASPSLREILELHLRGLRTTEVAQRRARSRAKSTPRSRR